MSQGVLIFICFLAIVFCIVSGFKLNRHVGLMGLALSYLIGCLIMGLKPKAVIGFFPYSIVFMMIGTYTFFGFAIENGTLKALADRVIYASGGRTWLMPIMFFIAAIVIAGCGMSAGASMVLAPLMFPIGSVCGINPLLTTIMLALGSQIGATVPWCSGGTVLRGVIENIGYEQYAYSWNWKLLAMHSIGQILVGAIAYIVFKGWKSSKGISRHSFGKPEPMTAVQKKNTALIIALLCCVLLPNVFQVLAPNPITKWMTTYFDNRMLVLLFSVIAGFIGVGDEKVILRKRVSWSTIITVAGVCVLMSVATEAGAVDLMASAVSAGVPTFLIGAVLCLFGGILSFFSGGLNTVLPMLATLVPTIVAATGLSPLYLLTCIFSGSMSTICSPFSSGGANMLAGIDNEEERTRLSLTLMPTACILCLVFCLLTLLGINKIFPAF